MKEIADSTEWGEWIPTLNISCEYTTRRGWYQKIGNIVTVCWHIVAESGGETEPMSISGVPYETSAAFGGGVAHNIITDTGNTFVGWMLSGGIISPRVQKQTASGAITLGSNVKYPYGSLTVGGSITFAIK